MVVWVGSLVVKELKRIVEASEITKYVCLFIDFFFLWKMSLLSSCV
jgi:hypothetical protein